MINDVINSFRLLGLKLHFHSNLVLGIEKDIKILGKPIEEKRKVELKGSAIYIHPIMLYI